VSQRYFVFQTDVLPVSEFQACMFAKNIRCDECDGTSANHGRNGECYRLQTRDKRHGQIERLR
jgi:hypothetical protein